MKARINAHSHVRMYNSVTAAKQARQTLEAQGIQVSNVGSKKKIIEVHAPVVGHLRTNRRTRNLMLSIYHGLADIPKSV